ncbi:MAG: DUF1015 domain-containing protein [Arenicellales bacterium WSBS_2016_MAG_OTU3]
MPKIYPFEGYLVAPEHAHEVASPAYDSMTPQQRSTFAAANPNNYVNTMRVVGEFAEKERPTPDELLTANRKVLDCLIESNRFEPLLVPSIFLYQLEVDGHEQTGLVTEISVDDYKNNTIKIHEHTRNDHEDQLTKYHEVVGASSSPICLAYAQDPLIDALVNEIKKTESVLNFELDDGLRQTVWRVDDEIVIAQLRSAFEQIDYAYLTDGHHRSASGMRYAELCRSRNADHTGDEPYNYLLVALFPDVQLRVFSINRAVKDLGGLSAEELIKKLSENFVLEEAGAAAAEPVAPTHFGMLLNKRWYALKLKPEIVMPQDAVAGLDVSLLENLILKPILGMQDTRSDERLEYVAGITGETGMMDMHNHGWEVVFALHPTTLAQLIAVADANKVMPPKSTWFDPKARSGVFLRMR